MQKPHKSLMRCAGCFVIFCTLLVLAAPPPFARKNSFRNKRFPDLQQIAEDWNLEGSGEDYDLKTTISPQAVAANGRDQKRTSKTVIKPGSVVEKPLNEGTAAGNRFSTTSEATGEQPTGEVSSQLENVEYVDIPKSNVELQEEASNNYVEAYRTWLMNVKEKYDSYIRPSFGGPAIDIAISIYIIAFRSISEVTMDYSVELYFRQTWLDKRLSFNSTLFGGINEIDVDPSAAQYLWIPDTNLVNSMSSITPIGGSGSMTHMELMRVGADGQLFQSRRISATAECTMDLRLYPFDSQVCRLIISSYGFRSADIIYSWDKQKSIELTPSVELPDFVIKSYRTKSYNALYSTGNFSTLEFCFILKRNAGYCAMQLLFPSTVLVAASWISLWLENEMVFSDVLGVILSILFLSYSYNNVMPKVSYVKAMDIYLGACLLFVFLSLVKMAIVKYLKKQATKKDEEENLNRRKSNAEDAVSSLTTSFSLPSRKISTAYGNNMVDSGISSVTMDPNQGKDPGKNQGKMSRSTSIVSTTSTLAKEGHLMAAKGAVLLFLSRIHDAASTRIHGRAWRNMKVFHYASQIVLPLAFSAFCFFFFVIYPVTTQNVTCDD